MKRGQLSIEFMFSLGMLLSLLLVLAVLLGAQRQGVSALREESEERSACLALATAVGKAYVNPGTEVTMRLERAARLSRSGAITVGESACTVPVPIATTELAAGTVTIASTLDGVVAHG